MGDLAGESLIVTEKGTVTREFILERCREAGIGLPTLIESRSFAFLLSQVQAGKGISFIAKSLLKYQLIRPGTITEKLWECYGIKISDETLRRWLIEAGLWKKSGKRSCFRQWRPREQTQTDGRRPTNGGNVGLTDIKDAPNVRSAPDHHDLYCVQ